MRYIAIDYGIARTGLAMCDESETFVSPLCRTQMHKKKLHLMLEQLSQLLKENEIEGIIVGLPLNMDGTEGDQAKLTRYFAEKSLPTITDLPVTLHDERLSSHHAEGQLSGIGITRAQKKQKKDMLAACNILNDYLGLEY